MFLGFASLLILSAAECPPNVVFLTVDTLRADHLGCYGYDQPTSPNLDALAEEGRLFENCVCEEPQTTPSFCSMLSSRPPRMTGVVRNAVALPPDIPIVPELFKAAGYQTACVQSNWNLKRDLCGLGRGFDQYHDDFTRRTLARWGRISWRNADEVTALAMHILKERDPEKPFFYWFHYMDPHSPYRFRREFNPAGRPLAGMKKVEALRARYDSEIAFADHHIGRLLKVIPKENTFVFFVADHGESLYEHKYVGHSHRIWQTNVHIPLFIRGPGVEPVRTRLPARGIDVGITLLGLAGLKPSPGMRGKDLLKKGIQSGRTRVIETFGGPIPVGPKACYELAERQPSWQAVISGDWKLITQGKKRMLFNLVADPMETDNYLDSVQTRLKKLNSHIVDWNKAVPRDRPDSPDLSEEDLEALRATGYL